MLNEKEINSLMTSKNYFYLGMISKSIVLFLTEGTDASYRRDMDTWKNSDHLFVNWLYPLMAALFRIQHKC
jgi:hypothetical protein